MGTRALAAFTILLVAGTAEAQDFDCAVAEAPFRRGIHSPTAVHAGGDISLRVAALYTPEAADSAIARGIPISTWIANAFGAWQGVLDSASTTGPRVVLAPLGTIELDIAETADCFAGLDTFRAHSRAAELRDSLLANLVVLFTARCSAAYQCVEGADCEASAYATARFAVAGTPTVEGGHALAHEAGHLLGMRHDAATDPTPGYNHGYRDEAGEFFTVMAFRGPLPRTDMVSAYSDPLRTFEGRPLGTFDIADNARVLRENAPIAATWNQDVSNEPGPSRSVGLSAYPNPAGAGWRVHVDAALLTEVSLELLDARGRSVWSASSHAGDTVTEVPAAGLAPGAYLLRGTWSDVSGQRIASITLTRTR